jgi:hypothetical protein
MFCFQCQDSCRPTWPRKVLVEKFDLKPIGTVEGDIAAMMAGN